MPVSSSDPTQAAIKIPQDCQHPRQVLKIIQLRFALQCLKDLNVGILYQLGQKETAVGS